MWLVYMITTHVTVTYMATTLRWVYMIAISVTVTCMTITHVVAAHDHYACNYHICDHYAVWTHAWPRKMHPRGCVGILDKVGLKIGAYEGSAVGGAVSETP